MFFRLAERITIGARVAFLGYYTRRHAETEIARLGGAPARTEDYPELFMVADTYHTKRGTPMPDIYVSHNGMEEWGIAGAFDVADGKDAIIYDHTYIAAMRERGEEGIRAIHGLAGHEHGHLHQSLHVRLLNVIPGALSTMAAMPTSMLAVASVAGVIGFSWLAAAVAANAVAISAAFMVNRAISRLSEFDATAIALPMVGEEAMRASLRNPSAYTPAEEPALPSFRERIVEMGDTHPTLYRENAMLNALAVSRGR